MPRVPPGMQSRSRGRQVAKVCVGTMVRTESLGTGASDLATTCVAELGSRDRTCSGPVRSSWVTSGEEDEADVEAQTSLDLHRYAPGAGLGPSAPELPLVYDSGGRPSSNPNGAARPVWSGGRLRRRAVAQDVSAATANDRRTDR